MRIRFLTFGTGFVPVAGLLVCAQLAIAQGTDRLAPRITQVDENNLVTLRGTVHPLARAQYDQGAVADSQPIRRGLLLLQRSPELETVLRQLLDSQQNRASLSYHQWLTPTQFGHQFGPADADVQKVTDWLTAHGFQVNRVSAGRTVIEFSGTAGQVRNAFHTEIHRYLVNGEEHFANANSVQIPAALAPVVAGTVSLHNFLKKPQSHVRGVFTRNNSTGEVTPLFTGTNQGTSFHALGPGDFDIIYNVPSMLNGMGQTIAIVGDSEICTASSPEFSIPVSQSGCGGVDDVAQFRSLFGLPSIKLPNVVVDGPDPGLNGDETEGDLDTEWAGAVAPGATIDFVIAENTEASAGIDLAAEHIVDYNLAPIMSESFSDCELNLPGPSNFYSELWEQAAAQGITVIVAAGDSGSAGCDNENNETTAVGYIAVNGIAATEFNVAVGGTDFDFNTVGYPSAYWNATNAASTQASAKSYIPETTWNDSCAQFATSLTACASATGGSLNIVSSGGGVSVNNAKPAFQKTLATSSVTGVNNGTRWVPDLSMFGSDGKTSNSFYIVCEADAEGGPCGTGVISSFLGVGGTSSSAQAFAGIMALVNQNMAPLDLSARQGNAGFVLYPLAANQQAAGLNCDSSNNPSPDCTFYDVTKGNNAVPCAGGTPNCSTVSSGVVGILASLGNFAWNAGAGYDLATGLGTINVRNLITNWPAAAAVSTPTTTTLCLSTTPTTLATCIPGVITGITHGTAVWVNIGVSPTPPNMSPGIPEDVALIGTFSSDIPGCGVPSCTGAGVDRFTINLQRGGLSNSDLDLLYNGTASKVTNYLLGGTYAVTAHYAGDGTLGASDSNVVSVTINPEPSTIKLAIGTINFLKKTITQLPSVSYGDFNLIRVDITGTNSGLETATGSVTLTDNGGPIVGPTGSSSINFNLNSEGYLEDQTLYLPVGSHSIVAKYNGDSSYNASSNSPAVLVTVTQCPTITTLASTNTAVSAGTAVTLTAFVDTETAGNPSGGSTGAALTGMVTFTTPAQNAMFRPVQPPHAQIWLVAGVGASFGLMFVLLVRFPPRRQWGVALTTMLLATIIGASISCGGIGGGSGGGGGGGGGSHITTLGSVSPTFVMDSDKFVAGHASITITPTTSQTITATYAGDANYEGSSSTSLTIAVQ